MAQRNRSRGDNEIGDVEPENRLADWRSKQTPYPEGDCEVCGREAGPEPDRCHRHLREETF